MLGQLNKKIFLKSNTGFTFPELLVSVAIFVLITTGLYTLMLTSQEHWDANQVQIQLHQELRRAAGQMINDLRQTGSAEPNLNASVPANGATYTAITFKKAASISSGALQWEANAIQFSRGGTGSTQLIKTQGGVQTVLANTISGLTFRRQSTSPDILEVTIQGQNSTDRGRSDSYQLSLEVQLRN